MGRSRSRTVISFMRHLSVLGDSSKWPECLATMAYLPSCHKGILRSSSGPSDASRSRLTESTRFADDCLTDCQVQPFAKQARPPRLLVRNIPNGMKEKS